MIKKKSIKMPNTISRKLFDNTSELMHIWGPNLLKRCLFFSIHLMKIIKENPNKNIYAFEHTYFLKSAGLYRNKDKKIWTQYFCLINFICLSWGHIHLYIQESCLSATVKRR